MTIPLIPSNNFEGDPRLIITANGTKLEFIGGQPVMDRGLENVALISLFTSQGWAGNEFFRDPNQKIGSNFEESANQPITLKSLNDIRDAAEKALNDPIFGKVTVVVTNPNGYRVDVKITIEPPGQDIKKLLVSKNGINWQSQAIEPAYRRI